MPDEAKSLLDAAMESRANFYKLKKAAENPQIDEDTIVEDPTDEVCPDDDRSVNEPVTDETQRS